MEAEAPQIVHFDYHILSFCVDPSNVGDCTVQIDEIATLYGKSDLCIPRMNCVVLLPIRTFMCL
jgi:hypothetical protein